MRKTTNGDAQDSCCIVKGNRGKHCVNYAINKPGRNLLLVQLSRGKVDFTTKRKKKWVRPENRWSSKRKETSCSFQVKTLGINNRPKQRDKDVSVQKGQL